MKKTRVFVDGEVLVAPHFSGIGHYTLELLRALDDLIGERNDIVVELGIYFRRYEYAQKFGFKNFRLRKTYLPLRITNALKIKGLQPYYDLLFGHRLYLFPNFTSWPLLRSRAIPIIYDLSFEFFPEYAEPNNQKFLSVQVKKSIERAARVITISANSKKEIAEFYGYPEKKISIIYPGIDQGSFFRYPAEAVAKAKAKYAVHGNYILFVGNIEPRKNLINLLKAYENLPEETRKSYSLLLIGGRGWQDDEIFDLIHKLRINGNHIQQPQGYVKDEDRAALFSGASLFVYPSKYEGFGIPPLEAMACGIPTITSDNSSLPEAVGDAAIMIDANSVEDLSDAIQHLLTHPEEHKEMIEKGYRQVNKYSWSNEAKKLLNLLLEVSSE